VLSRSLQKLGQHVSSIFRSQNWENLTNHADILQSDPTTGESLLSKDFKFVLQSYLDDAMDHQFSHSKNSDKHLNDIDSEHRFCKLHVLMLTMSECFAKQVNFHDSEKSKMILIFKTSSDFLLSDDAGHAPLVLSVHS